MGVKQAAREVGQGPTRKSASVPVQRSNSNMQRSTVTKQGGGDVESTERPMECLKDLVSVAKAQVIQYLYFR